VFDVLATDDTVGDRVRVLLMRVVRAGIDFSFERDATLLLNDVSCLMRGGMEVRCAREPDAALSREGLRTKGRCGFGRCAAHLSPDVREIVATEQRLQRLNVWKRFVRIGDTV
jgi:hypothetical protein